MAMSINTNIASLNAQRNLTKTQGALSRSMERLSSGLRINSAKDDAAGLAISTRFTAQTRGLNQAVRNANDGISLLQTSEGAMQETVTILQRMREIAVQAANETYSTSDRTSMGDEVTSLMSEINRIASDTEFNGVAVLSDAKADTAISFQVGAKANQVISVTLSGSSAVKIDLTNTSVVSATAASAMISNIDISLDKISTIRGKYGAVQNRLDSTIANLMNVAENVSAANGRIVDADFAAETSNMTKQQILSQAGVAMLTQGKQLPQQVLQLRQ